MTYIFLGGVAWGLAIGLICAFFIGATRMQRIAPRFDEMCFVAQNTKQKEHRMTRIILLSFLFSVCPLSSLSQASILPEEGPPISILPVCFAVGPVYLNVDANSVKGFIGTEWVALTRLDDDSVVGELKKRNFSLRVDEEALTVVGTFDNQRVRWRLSPDHDAVYGLQSCLIDTNEATASDRLVAAK